jgi:hypothetical protein
MSDSDSDEGPTRFETDPDDPELVILSRFTYGRVVQLVLDSVNTRREQCPIKPGELRPEGVEIKFTDYALAHRALADLKKAGETPVVFIICGCGDELDGRLFTPVQQGVLAVSNRKFIRRDCHKVLPLVIQVHQPFRDVLSRRDFSDY